jgi:hypothetical protein
MMKPYTVYPHEGKVFQDRVSGLSIRQLTGFKGHSQYPYFTDDGWFDNDRKMLFIADRDNARNLYCIDIDSGEISRLTNLTNMSSYGHDLSSSMAVNHVYNETYYQYHGCVYTPYIVPRGSGRATKFRERRVEGEMVGHEYWFLDGVHVGYQVHQPEEGDSKSYFGFAHYDGTGEIEAPAVRVPRPDHIHSIGFDFVVSDTVKSIKGYKYNGVDFDGPALLPCTTAALTGAATTRIPALLAMENTWSTTAPPLTTATFIWRPYQMTFMRYQNLRATKMTDIARKKFEPHAIGTKIVRYKYLYLLFLPVLGWYILFHYAPMYGTVIAFKDYNLFTGIANSPWSGFKYFQQFFESMFFW